MSQYQQEHKRTAYESYVTCCGSIIGCCCCSYMKLQTSNVGMLTYFGSFRRQVVPGLNYYNPLTESIIPVSISTKVIDMQKQRIYTKDNMSVQIDTSLFYRIVDPFKATFIVKDILASVMQLTFVTLRTICGEYILQELLTKRQEIADKIEQFVRRQSQQWGIYVEYLLLKDLHLSNYLQNNLNQVPKAKRAAQSKIISAKADLQSAKLYREAADILDIKAAMQIRFLETLQLMDKMQSSKTIVMPLTPDYDS